METAARYVAGGYLWNSGNFLFRADTRLVELAGFVLAMATAVARAKVDLGFVRPDSDVFSQAPKQSIDYALMEKRAYMQKHMLQSGAEGRMDFAGFDWDHGNRAKCRKHGVSIAEIEGLFRGTMHVAPNPIHSAREERFKAIGRTPSGRNVLVAFTLRRRGSDVLIRPIGARYMHRKEVEHYEKETAKAEE